MKTSQHSPGVVHAPLSYHDVPAGRLYAATVAGLQAAGIPLIALGVMRAGKQVISGCFTFSPFATESLPTSLGGSDNSAASSLGPASLHFFREAAAHSPSRTVFQETPRRAPPPAAPVSSRAAPPAPVDRGFGASVLEAIARPRGVGGRFAKRVPAPPSAPSASAAEPSAPSVAATEPSPDAGADAHAAEAKSDGEEAEAFEDSRGRRGGSRPARPRIGPSLERS